MAVSLIIKYVNLDAANLYKPNESKAPPSRDVRLHRACQKYLRVDYPHSGTTEAHKHDRNNSKIKITPFGLQNHPVPTGVTVLECEFFADE